MTVSSNSFESPDVNKQKENRNIDGLIKALDYKKDNHVRLAAAEALGEIGDARAVEPLIFTLKDTGSWVVANALDNLGWKPDLGENGAWYWTAKRDFEKCVVIGAPAVEPLIALLKENGNFGFKDPRPGAAYTLGRIGDARAVVPLIIALKDNNQSVSKAAEKALMKIGASAVEPLIAALKDGDTNIRSAAPIVLEKMGALAVNPLIAALKDGDANVRSTAAITLGKIGDARAVEPLIFTLKDTGSWVVANALDNLGWKPDLGENGAWYWTAKRDFEKCVLIGAPAVEPLIALLKENADVRWAAAKALGVIGDPRAVDPLIAALKDNNCFSQAVDALGNIGDARAVEPLIAILKDESKIKRKAAAEALKKMYHNGQLDQQSKNQILGMQNVMAFHNDTHDDQHHDVSQNNTHTSSDCRHYDSHSHSHTDEGIGVIL